MEIVFPPMKAGLLQLAWMMVGIFALAMLSACGPSEKRKAELAEQQRIDCLDKLCEGDVVPKHDLLKEEALKLNGQWFIGPKEYFSTGINGAGFEWWDHKILSSSMKRPPEAQALAVAGKGYDFSIEIFLRHHDGVMHGPSRYEHLQQAEAEGRLISKETPRPGLEIWHTRETDGLGPGLWYVATKFVATDPNGAVLSCRSGKLDRCVTAFIWRPGIAADMRFRSALSNDWPEIYKETIEILEELREVK